MKKVVVTNTHLQHFFNVTKIPVFAIFKILMYLNISPYSSNGAKHVRRKQEDGLDSPAYKAYIAGRPPTSTGI